MPKFRNLTETNLFMGKNSVTGAKYFLRGKSHPNNTINVEEEDAKRHTVLKFVEEGCIEEVKADATPAAPKAPEATPAAKRELDLKEPKVSEKRLDQISKENPKAKKAEEPVPDLTKGISGGAVEASKTKVKAKAATEKK